MSEKFQLVLDVAQKAQVLLQALPALGFGLLQVLSWVSQPLCRGTLQRGALCWPWQGRTTGLWWPQDAFLACLCLAWLTGAESVVIFFTQNLFGKMADILEKIKK